MIGLFCLFGYSPLLSAKGTPDGQKEVIVTKLPEEKSPLDSVETSLEGRIVDKEGNGIFAASIYLQAHYHIATVSREDGSFCLSFPNDFRNDTLVVSFIGFKTERMALKRFLPGESWTIVLKEDWMALNEVVVAANPEITEEFSLEKLEKLNIYLSPVAAGDPLNALSILPMSTNVSETANPEFRGSAANASQVVLNGINIANPVRNTQMNGMGNFSLFNTELIQHMNVYASNPPLTNGNSLAGLVDIKTTQHLEQNLTQIAASLANVGLLRAQKISENIFFQLYGNLQFSKPYLYLNDTQEMLQAFSSQDIGLNLHTNIGKSDFNYFAYFIDENFEGKEYHHSRKAHSKAEKQRIFSIFNWHHQWEKFHFEANLGQDWDKGEIQLAAQTSALEEVHYQGNLKFKYFLNDKLFLQAGISDEGFQMLCQSEEPAHYWDQRENAPLMKKGLFLEYHLPESFIYLRYREDKWIGGLGLRRRFCDKEKCSPWAYQAQLRYLSENHGSLQLSAGQYYAYVYPLLEDPRINMQQSRQLVLEYKYHSDYSRVSAALFLKQEKGEGYIGHLREYIPGTRNVRGAEFSFEQQWEALKLSASYTYLNAKEIWKDSVYSAHNDLPYFLKIQASHTNERFFTIACSAMFRPGLRYTPVNKGIFHEETESFRPVFGGYNSRRMKSYQRFDVSMNKVFVLPKEKMMVTFLSLSNIFNHHNQTGIVYSKDYSREIASCPMQLYSIYFGLQMSF